MTKPPLEWKVGLFVVISLALAGLLIMKFSKGQPFFTQSYNLNIMTSDVGGLQPGAGVYMAGVRVGTLESVDLDQTGRTVTMRASILDRFHIRTNAVFSIEQAGFLGDQYVFVLPGTTNAPFLKPNDSVFCQPAFNFQQMARAGSGLVRQFNQTAEKLEDAINRINDSLLSEETLGDIRATFKNFRLVSERALGTVRGVSDLVSTNSHPLSIAVTNLVVFSDQLNQLASQFQEILSTNRFEISAAIKNIESATRTVDKLLAEVQAGRGLAGNLLNNPEVENDFRQTLSNLSMLSSNLNAHGILWKPRKPRPSLPARLHQGKNLF